MNRLNSPLKGADLEKRRQWLLQKRAELRSGLNTSKQDLADMKALKDGEDNGLVNEEIASNQSVTLDQVGDALDRILDKRYGVCEGCGDKIPAMRMDALPFATRCIHCQREEEREQLRAVLQNK